VKKHLSYWEDQLDIEQFKKHCGDFKVPFKCEVREHIKERGYESILDCGAGVFSEYYGFKYDGYHIEYSATEITPSYVEFGRLRGINVIESNIENIPFADESFECSICFDVLNHQVEYEKAIKEMLRVTKKEVIISFFKPFIEEAREGKDYSGNYKMEYFPQGVREHRVINEDNQTTCLYTFFNKAKFVNFLKSLNVVWWFKKGPAHRNILFLEKI